jgi:hypothetical protein
LQADWKVQVIDGKNRVKTGRSSELMEEASSYVGHSCTAGRHYLIDNGAGRSIPNDLRPEITTWNFFLS